MQPTTTGPVASLSANDRQPGGTHYAASFQHWDLVPTLGLGYFEGQITKYLYRHRKKNGLLDVEKAEHFLEKLIELNEAGVELSMAEKADAALHVYETPFVARLLVSNGVPGRAFDQPRQLFEAFLAAQRPPLRADEQHAVFLVCFWQNATHLQVALRIVRSLKAEYAAADAQRATQQTVGSPPATPVVVTEGEARAQDETAEYAAHCQTGGAP